MIRKGGLAHNENYHLYTDMPIKNVTETSEVAAQSMLSTSLWALNLEDWVFCLGLSSVPIEGDISQSTEYKEFARTLNYYPQRNYMPPKKQKALKTHQC